MAQRHEGGASLFGAIADLQAPFCWTFLLGNMPMNVPVGDYGLPGSFQVKIILWLLTPLILRGESPAGGFGLGHQTLTLRV